MLAGYGKEGAVQIQRFKDAGLARRNSPGGRRRVDLLHDSLFSLHSPLTVTINNNSIQWSKTLTHIISLPFLLLVHCAALARFMVVLVMGL